MPNPRLATVRETHDVYSSDRQPLVIHCNGNFHSDYGLGTATRLAQRAPLAQAAIISMIAVPDVSKADVTTDRKKGHYLLIVPAPPKTPTPVKPPEKTVEKKPGETKPKEPTTATPR